MFGFSTSELGSPGRMIRWDGYEEIYLHRDPVDLRKAINGLSVMVGESFGRDPFGGALFLFSNRRGNLIKILYWDRTGFALWQKRLEKARYKWPKLGMTENVVPLDACQLNELLEGYDVWRSPPHETVTVSHLF